jgi:hypothetical protein
MASEISIGNVVKEADDVYSFEADITAHTDGSVDSVATPFDIDGWVFLATTNPGATAPTDEYSLALNDSEGIDVFGGELETRSESNSEQAAPKIGNTYGARFVSGPLTIAVSGNSVSGALIALKVYFIR